MIIVTHDMNNIKHFQSLALFSQFQLVTIVIKSGLTMSQAIFETIINSKYVGKTSKKRQKVDIVAIIFIVHAGLSLSFK
jgi:hypothetical protein